MCGYIAFCIAYLGGDLIYSHAGFGAQKGDFFENFILPFFIYRTFILRNLSIRNEIWHRLEMFLKSQSRLKFKSGHKSKILKILFL